MECIGGKLHAPKAARHRRAKATQIGANAATKASLKKPAFVALGHKLNPIVYFLQDNRMLNDVHFLDLVKRRVMRVLLELDKDDGCALWQLLAALSWYHTVSFCSFLCVLFVPGPGGFCRKRRIRHA